MPEQLPVWLNEGVEPPESLKTSGWEPGMKPSAQYMNWLLNRTYKVLEELQNGGDMTEIEQRLDDLEREVTMHLEDLVKHGVYGTATGTNTLELTLDNVPAYVPGMLVAFKNTTENTGAVTLTINELGPKPIKKANGRDLASGHLKAGAIYQVRYDGTVFFLLGEGGDYGTATSSHVLEGQTIGTEEGLIEGMIKNYGRAVLGQGYTNPKSYKADGGGSLVVEPNTGYYEAGKNANGFGSIIMTDSNFIASNIVSGKSIFGISGTASVASMGGKRWKHIESPFVYNSSNLKSTMTITDVNFTVKTAVLVRLPYDTSGAVAGVIDNNSGMNSSGRLFYNSSGTGLVLNLSQSGTTVTLTLSGADWNNYGVTLFE
ncbi:MAG: hypothetical protein ACI33M_03230 [Lysinibacillus sp.]